MKINDNSHFLKKNINSSSEMTVELSTSFLEQYNFIGDKIIAP